MTYESGRRPIYSISGLRAPERQRRPLSSGEEVLRRHAERCSNIETEGDRRRIASGLMELISDDMVLMHAMDLLGTDGPKAAGPNGIQLSDLTRNEKWQLARNLKQQLNNRSYRRNQTKRIRIPKQGKPGQFRTIDISNIEDQVVQKAIAEVITPLIDPQFDSRSFGFRPKRGRIHALAAALTIAEAGKTVWITEDLKDAFTTVPHGRLRDALSLHDIPPVVVGLIAECIRNDRDRGIPQGGCLSPLLLNVYLDKHLDKVWHSQSPNTDLIRYADDICILCGSQCEANEAYSKLERVLMPTGMRLKGNSEESIKDLREQGTTADMLGYLISLQEGEMTVSISDKAWNRLAAR
jgi:RNA-directed DNA polymerase